MGDFEVWYYYVEERSFYVILQIGSINCMISTCFCCFSRPICFQSDISCNHSMCPFRGGGGGGALTPHFGRYVPQQSEKMGGSRTSLRVKMEVYRTSLRVKMEVYRTNCLLWNWLCRDKGVSWTRFLWKMCMRCPCRDASGWHSGWPLTRGSCLNAKHSGWLQ